MVGYPNNPRERWRSTFRRTSDYSRSRYTLRTDGQDFTQRDFRFLLYMRILGQGCFYRFLRLWSKRTWV